MDKFDERARKTMWAVVNEWHRRVGIDDVMKTKLTTVLADTVATDLFQSALRDTWNEAIEAAENAHMDVTERLGGGWAAHMAANKAIRALKVEKP